MKTAGPTATVRCQPTTEEAAYNVAEIENLVARSAMSFRPQREVLQAIPAKVAEEALQIYLW